MRNTSKPKLPPTHNNNNKRANSHTRIQPQQRGYYYSSANTQRRLQNKLNNNNNNSKIEIDASSSSSYVMNIPLKRKWENELELYNKNNISEFIYEILTEHVKSFLWLLLVEKDVIKDKFCEEIFLYEDVNFYLSVALDKLFSVIT